ncbi:MAG: LysM domain-containing protein [Ilumatobacteraceae bacterium]
MCIAGPLVLAVGCGSDDAADATTTTSAPVTATAAPTTTIPATTTSLDAYYEVQPGDSLGAIAGRFDVRLEDLIAINEIANPDHIQVGDRLLIPPPTILLNDVSTSTGSASTSSSNDAAGSSTSVP